MTRYRSGQRAEWRARDLLKQRGHHTVIRAAGSKGPWDLIAVAKDRICFVQVKRGRKISKAERAELAALRHQLPAVCTVEIWHFEPRKRLPDVEVL